jgi:hypothetical protein
MKWKPINTENCSNNKRMNKKSFSFLVMVIFLISCVSSVGFINIDNCQMIGEQEIDSVFELYQTCPSCTFVNVTYIKSPTMTNTNNQAMDKNGSTYTLDFYNTTEVGDYFYTTEGDKDGVSRTECFSFKISVTGESSEGASDYIPSIIILLLAVIILILGILFNNEIAKGILFTLSVLFSYLSFQLTLIIIKSSNFIQRSGAADYLLTVFTAITWIIGGFTIIAIVLISIWVFKRIQIKKGFIDPVEPIGV